MDSIKSTLGLGDDGASSSESSSSSDSGGGVMSQAWNAVSDGASQAWNAVSDTASSAVNAVGDGASSLTSTVAADASAAWDAVSSAGGAVMDKIQHPFGAPQDTGPIVVPVDTRQLDDEGHSPEQAAWLKDHPKSPYELQKEQEEKNVRTNAARDAGFDDSDHMQQYIAAKQQWQKQVDDALAHKGDMPPGLDDYMRQQHLRGPSQAQKAQRQADHDYMPGQ